MGLMNRRDFMGHAGALGVSAAMAGTLLTTAAKAQEPKKGGVLRAGVQGGDSTNTLDPALAASEVPFPVNMLWGEMLVEVARTDEIQYAAGRRGLLQRRCDGVEVQDPPGREVPQRRRPDRRGRGGDAEAPHR